MFGIKFKIYNIFALVFALLGTVALALKVFGVLPLPSWEGVIDNMTMTLISLILYLIGIVIYMRPKMKKLKKMQQYTAEYRNDLYNDLLKNGGNREAPAGALFFQNEEGRLQYDSVVFSDLSFSDAIVVVDSLMKDFVMIVYGVLDEKKRKITISKKEHYEYLVRDKEGKEVKRVLIDKNEFLK